MKKLQSLKKIRIIPKEKFLQINDEIFVASFKPKILFELLYENEIGIENPLGTSAQFDYNFYILISNTTKRSGFFEKLCDEITVCNVNKIILNWIDFPLDNQDEKNVKNEFRQWMNSKIQQKCLTCKKFYNYKPCSVFFTENEVRMQLNIVTKSILNSQGKTSFSELNDAFLNFFKAVDDCRKLTKDRNNLSRTFVQYATK